MKKRGRFKNTKTLEERLAAEVKALRALVCYLLQSNSKGRTAVSFSINGQTQHRLLSVCSRR
ncbi:hypothetical protein FBZ94_102146 [Bradyrhizobium sacchari]|uniref:Uncharacterized protein n=1 Tax=Bradyrhizobium sacchari TaxID=1399419 RepID=A0A560KJT9_9BRAD|nr:hypothetical protein FBZ94_102146 [Bradyrhizobium sacchari]TWB80930.1 hypothetical protein FBZ95_102147 [Bradyrhizobium sacchari]